MLNFLVETLSPIGQISEQKMGGKSTEFCGLSNILVCDLLVHLVFDCVFACVFSVTSFLDQLLIIKLLLFSILVEMAAKAAKQKEKMRTPEEGTARIAAIFWFCTFLFFFLSQHAQCLIKEL